MDASASAESAVEPTTDAVLTAGPPAASGAAPRPLQGLRRPSPALMKYYLLQSILTGPFLVIMIPYRYFRYRTLRYLFDDEGVTVRWGVLFRREISLTYARIQDIHLVSNVIERWFGLGRVQIQTASGQAGAEMTVEGLPDFEHVRDELYRRMRGARDPRARTTAGQPRSTEVESVPAAATALPAADLVTATEALHAAVEELRAIRELLGRKRNETA